MDSIKNLLTGPSSKPFGEIINDRCQELNISERQLSAAVNVERNSLKRMINGTAQKIDHHILSKLSLVLGLDFHVLRRASMTAQHADEDEFARRCGYIFQNFDIERLFKTGFLDTQTDFVRIENRIKSFFDLDSIFQYSAFNLGYAYRSSKRNHSDLMRDFWLNSVQFQLKNIKNPNPYNRDKLKQVTTRIRQMTLDERSGYHRFVNALFECGVTVFVSAYLTGTHISGCSLIVDGKPCIVLTEYGKKYDQLWLTLAHEIHHVLMDWDVISREPHLSGELTLFSNQILEDRANCFAAEAFVPQKMREQLQRYISMDGIIRQQARLLNVHPSLIYGLYLEDRHREGKTNEFAKYNKPQLRPPSSITFKPQVDIWRAESLSQTVPLLKQIFTSPTSDQQPENISAPNPQTL